MDTLLPAHPSSNITLLKHSFLVYRRSFAHVFVLALLLGFIIFLPRFISNVLKIDFIYAPHIFSPIRLWILLIDLIAVMFFVAIFWRIHCAIRHKHEPMMEDLNVGIRKTLLVFFASLIQSFILFGLALLAFSITVIMFKHSDFFFRTEWGIFYSGLIFGGQAFLILYVFTLFYFFIPVIALENKGIFTSIQKSVALVWNHWWRTFSLQITPWLTYILTLFILKFVLNLNVHIYFVYDERHSLMGSILQCLLFIFFIPWVASVMMVQLKDLEIRNKLLPKPKRRKR